VLQTAYIAALQSLGTPEWPLYLRCACRMSAERMGRRFHCGLHSLPHDSHAFKLHLLFSLSGRNGTPFIEHFHDCLVRNTFVVSCFASKCELKAVESAQIPAMSAKPQHLRRLRLRCQSCIVACCLLEMITKSRLKSRPASFDSDEKESTKHHGHTSI
jgi:hypothetical protein